ncbi:MAG: hypothetical protein JXR83_22880 [Deltaproteobacteria bacterium]|nr:hypothetical protein [Deltaproteobacteria bacterium]
MQSYQLFDDDEFTWYRYPNEGNYVRTSSGQLDIDFAAAAGGGEVWAGLQMASRTSLRERTLRARIANPVDPENASLRAYLLFEFDRDNRVGLTAGPGQLVAAVRLQGLEYDQTVPGYDQNALRWWQLRHLGDRLYFETSADGALWQEVHSITTPDFIDNGLTYFGAGTLDNSLTNADTISYADLNAELDPDPWCPASSRQDGFDGQALGVAWSPSPASDCEVAVSGSALHLRAPAIVSTSCFVESDAIYRLADSSVSVRVLSAPAENSVYTNLALRTAHSTWIQLGHHDNHLYAYAHCQGSGSRDTWSDPEPLAGRDRLRVSHSGGKIHFWARSEAALPWVEVHDFTCDDPFDAVYVLLTLSFSEPDASGSWHHAVFDDYNLTP